jgi:UDP-N-acetylmuramoyl-tripeptide--D-alanyl-D-alanine ligase
VIALNLEELARLVGGTSRGSAVEINGVSTDSRTLQPGQLFVALQGLRHDGHDAVPEAVTRGAAAIMVSRAVSATTPQVQVGDTRKALGLLAQGWRLRHTCPVIGITGSNGKTTTKELVASILRRRGPVLATQGNLNNHIGVPLTLFGLAPEHRAAVIEMGANAMADIADLAEIARPTIGIVTLCGPAHLEGFGSIENVAVAKGRIFEALPADGIAIINADDRFAEYWRKSTSASNIVTFGLGDAADVSASQIELGGPGEGVRFHLRSPWGEADVALALDGEHNVRNALAATAAAMCAGASLADVVAGLADASPVKGRLVLRTGRTGARIIDDSYNANPASLAAALAVLARASGRRWLVLGDMGELGATETAAHVEAGVQARAAGVERLFTLGQRARHAAASFGPGAEAFDELDALHALLAGAITAEVTILVKASRMMGLDRLVERLSAEAVTPC